MNFTAINVIARQEFRINIRNRWILIFAMVFAALTLAIAYFGMVTSAIVGFQSFTRTSASLLNLVLYIVPLGSLALSALSFTGDRGTAELLFSQPVSRFEILSGKILGLFASIVTATFLGFGASGMVVASQAGNEGNARYLAFVVFTLLLALAFLSIGALIATLAGTRSKALGLVFAAWFFFVVFYDLIVIGAAFVLNQHTANLIIFLSIFGNPIDLVRVSSLMVLGNATIFGAAGSALLKFFHGAPAALALLVSALALWVAVPALVSNRILRKREF
jgi:Cu-processing system permease protein